jgi:2,4-dienoyl-CoA reductase-like NADH-dependent reductase (Old Yellow Enzyme family)
MVGCSLGMSRLWFTIGGGIVNNGYTRSMAISAVASGAADMVAFGRPFISNPDLVNRLRFDEPLAAVDATTLYGGGAVGYTDYPVFLRSDFSPNADGNPRALVESAA